MPYVSIGIAADGNVTRAAERAILEAVRARLNVRRRAERYATRERKDARTIVHWERAHYWAEGTRHEKLDFLTSGPIETDADQRMYLKKTHFETIIEWCAKKRYECASVTLTNATHENPFHVEYVLIPEMQPLHHNEKYPYLSGPRVSEVPRLFGYAPREEAYTEDPHPFV